MLDKPLTRDDLETFFSIAKPAKSFGPDMPRDYRPLNRVLRALDIRLLGGTTRWPVVWRALGLAEEQDPQHHGDLTAPLLDAKAVARLIGVSDDPSILYRWEKGKLPAGAPPFPVSLDLSNGRENARAKRWRRAEVLAWHSRQPLPRYAKPAPVFGALTPVKRGLTSCSF